MSIRDLQLAAREHLMVGMQISISRIADETVQQQAIRDFRRVEKYLGFEPESWSPFC